ncbi:MAG: hypothetical protein IANPNBLG_00992 [Bryobacteraceae bacterium]|nr:hypothetical protein [Bryobacteraceae bacterium]MCZ2077036.1 hypothetical protein [Bryobacterales bacterium]
MTHYSSTLQHESRSIPGVTFTLERLSFGKRLELLRRVHALAGKLEFCAASETVASQFEAAILEKSIQQIYLECCLVQVQGLLIDGEAASVDILLQRGPGSLVEEIATTIQGQMTLSAEERKN